MSVQHKLRTTGCDRARKAANADHPLVGGGCPADRRVMDHEDTKQALFSSFFKQLGCCACLSATKIAGC
ncbi:hypothetical protein D3C80_1736980 [compost metagenome]